ncbi:organic cation/carnitine transporter 7 [Drosophila obscura]|uniref:organic cation/carnitine transporter 7 n=1 Tax=Drosophila obscura TaxID=7282 RepID=UPI001BB2C5BA|nr:organic cation/carnitine transporter 7 [Drosophila obscura]
MASKRDTETKDVRGGQSVELDEALKEIGFGCGQVLVLIFSSFANLLAVNETFGMSIIVVASSCDLSTTAGQKSLMMTSMMVGMTISGFYVGYLIDTKGRVRILRWMLLVTIVLSVVSALMPEVYGLSAMRFLVGIFLCGPATCLLGYMTEFSSPHARPPLVVVFSLAIGVSLIYCPLVAKLFLPKKYCVLTASSYLLRPWRFLMLLYTLPGVIALLGLCFLPESPYYLMSVKRKEEAQEVLAWLCRRNRKNKDELNIELIDFQRHTIVAKANYFKLVWDDSIRLVKPPYCRDFMVCTLLSFGMFLISLGLGMWYPLLRSQDNSQRRLLCDVLSKPKNFDQPKNVSASNEMPDFTDPIYYGIAYILFYFLALLLLLCMSRKHVFVCYVSVAAICGMALNFIKEPIAILICFSTMMILPGVMITLVSSVLVDCMPTQLRAKALSLNKALSRLGAILGCLLVGLMLQVSCVATLNIFVAYLIFCIVLCFLLPK